MTLEYRPLSRLRRAFVRLWSAFSPSREAALREGFNIGWESGRQALLREQVWERYRISVEDRRRLEEAREQFRGRLRASIEAEQAKDARHIEMLFSDAWPSPQQSRMALEQELA